MRMCLATKSKGLFTLDDTDVEILCRQITFLSSVNSYIVNQAANLIKLSS